MTLSSKARVRNAIDAVADVRLLTIDGGTGKAKWRGDSSSLPQLFPYAVSRLFFNRVVPPVPKRDLRVPNRRFPSRSEKTRHSWLGIILTTISAQIRGMCLREMNTSYLLPGPFLFGKPSCVVARCSRRRGPLLARHRSVSFSEGLQRKTKEKRFDVLF